jgi:DnaJ-class molecular chaperone
MPEKDLYAVLGVSRQVSADDLRKAYRKLARETHPDVNPGNKKAEERFKEISHAYDVLSDPDKRKRYDEFGMAGLVDGFDPEQARAYQRWSQRARRGPGPGAGAQGFEGIDLEDLLSNLGGAGGFADLFGGASGRAARGPAAGGDTEADLEVDFLSAARGGEMRIEIPGRGSVTVKIPAGSEDGSRIRLRGQGRPGAHGAPPGNLTLNLRVRPHPFFRRNGADLELDLPVSLPELVLGAEVEVPTPDGAVRMRIPKRAQNGQKLRVRGKGAAQRGNSQERGDLYVVLQLQLPAGASDADSERLEALARELEPLYAGRDLRAHLKERR